MTLPMWYFKHPSKVHVSKYFNMSYDGPLLKEFITPSIIGVSHLSDEIFTF